MQTNRFFGENSRLQFCASGLFVHLHFSCIHVFQCHQALRDIYTLLILAK